MSMLIGLLAWLVYSYNPELGMNTPQIIRYWNYPVETHHVSTSDGYILTMFRIPHGRSSNGTDAENKPVVLLQHALLDSSFGWVVNLPHESLAYILADLGYDVWLGNNRGNRYSTAHETYNIDSKEFWDFSWDEMATFDLPAEIEYVLDYTNHTSLSYVGFSQGTMQMFANLAASDELWEKVNYFAALGPVAWTNHIKDPVAMFLADYHIDKLYEIFGMKKFLTNQFINYYYEYFCHQRPNNCVDSTISGQANVTRMDIYMAEFPSGTSVKNMAHFVQGFRTDKFIMFDYGSKWKNLEHYGTDEPPEYDLTKIDKVPISLFSGSADVYADPEDVSRLQTAIAYRLKTNLQLYGYTHPDFILGVNSFKAVYPHVIADMEELNPLRAK